MRVDADDFARPCSCGKKHHIEVKEIIIKAGAVEQLAEMMLEGELREYISPLIICDTNTYAATEEAMEDIYDRCQVITLDAEDLCADQYAVEIIQSNMEEDIDLILAVGGGTIHDLSRYVAHQQGIPFVSVPTAASGDGFVTTVAAMNWDGMKRTFPAKAPICVVADTDIFARAPRRLNAAGASDLFGKYICLADWKIAHLVTGEYFCQDVYKLEKKALKGVRACIKGIREQDAEDSEALMYALILSGLAMQMIGNSRPASCGEHHITHLWEMEVLNGRLDALHGEMVGLGTLLCLREYKRIARAIRQGRCQVREHNGLEEELIQRTFREKQLLDGIYAENTPDPLEEISPEELEACLPAVADIIEELPEPEELEEMLEKGGCVSRLEQIGLDESIVAKTLQLAPYVRNRLSLLRLAKMLVIDGKEE